MFKTCLWLLALATLSVLQATSARLNRQAAERHELTSQDALPLSEILDEVALNIEHFEENLPDLICVETLEQTILDAKGARIKHDRFESALTGRQTKRQTPRGVQYDFKETREVRSVNGAKPREPLETIHGVQVAGAYSSILISHFGTRDRKDFLWTLLKSTGEKEKYFVVKFESEPRQQHQFYLFDGTEMLSRQKGEALIDADAFQVARIEYEELHLPASVTEMRYVVTYAPVKLGGEEFWLPSTAETITRNGEDGSLSRAQHRYTAYRKFTGAIKVVDQ